MVGADTFSKYRFEEVINIISLEPYKSQWAESTIYLAVDENSVNIGYTFKKMPYEYIASGSKNVTQILERIGKRFRGLKLTFRNHSNNEFLSEIAEHIKKYCSKAETQVIFEKTMKPWKPAIQFKTVTEVMLDDVAFESFDMMRAFPKLNHLIINKCKNVSWLEFNILELTQLTIYFPDNEFNFEDFRAPICKTKKVKKIAMLNYELSIRQLQLLVYNKNYDELIVNYKHRNLYEGFSEFMKSEECLNRVKRFSIIVIQKDMDLIDYNEFVRYMIPHSNEYQSINTKNWERIFYNYTDEMTFLSFQVCVLDLKQFVNANELN